MWPDALSILTRRIKRRLGLTAVANSPRPVGPRLERVVILDTWVNDTNLGNRIIMQAVEKHVQLMFPRAFVYHAPALEYLRAGRHLVEKADHIFLAGTNLLSADMGRTSEWALTRHDVHWLKNVSLMGVGWWQYQHRAADRFTRRIMRALASGHQTHSVRDGHTQQKLLAQGVRAINTGCPTLWGLHPNHCAAIPHRQARDVLVTFTEYNTDHEADRRMFDMLHRCYERVFVWPQQYHDHAYAHAICHERATLLPPTLEALDETLTTRDIDYVGTRLHAGIRGLQQQRRSIIIAVDNRAMEMGRDFQLPVLTRRDLGDKLESMIRTAWPTRVTLDYQAIAKWKAQFVRHQAHHQELARAA